MKFNTIYRSRWSNSKFAYLFKDTENISKKWLTIDEMFDEMSKPRPMIDSILDGVQDAIYMPLDFIHSIDIFIRNRFQTQTHVLKSNLEKGVWHEYSQRIAIVISDSFIDWMESEYCGCDKFDADKLINTHLWEISLKRDERKVIEVDDPEYGTPTNQAIAAKKLFEIYQYWKYQRPAMIEAEVLSGWGYNELDTEYLNMIIENRNSMWT